MGGVYLVVVDLGGYGPGEEVRTHDPRLQVEVQSGRVLTGHWTEEEEEEEGERRVTKQPSWTGSTYNRLRRRDPQSSK